MKSEALDVERARGTRMASQPIHRSTTDRQPGASRFGWYLIALAFVVLIAIAASTAIGSVTP